MNKRSLFALYLCVAVGAARFVDMLLFTEHDTGFVTAGSIWLRYGVLALALAVLSFILHKAPVSAAPATQPRVLQVLLCLLAAQAAACTALRAVTELLLPTTSFGNGESGVTTQVFALMLRITMAAALLCLCILCVRALLHSSTPRAYVLFALLAFFVLTLLRYAEDPASLHRITHILPLFSSMAALAFFVKWISPLWLVPDEHRLRSLRFCGFCAFLLCTCIELPQTLLQTVTHGSSLYAVAFSLLLGTLGIIGLWTALRVTQPQEEKGETNAE